MGFRFNIVDTVKTAVMFSVLIGFGSVVSIFSPISSDFLTIVLVFFLMIIDKSYKIDLKFFKVLLCVYIATSILIILTSSSFKDYSGIYLRSTVVILLITAFANNYSEIVKHLIKALWILMGLSLINFILAITVPNLFIETCSSNGYRVHTIGLIFNYMATSDILGVEFVRNQSIFWEPGVLQILANILIYYLVIEENKPVKSSFVPIFILLSTGSTSGFLILMFILLVKFRRIFSMSGSGLLHTLSVTFIIVAFVPLFYSELNNKFTSKEGSISTTARLYDLYMSFIVIKNNPIVGIGMSQEKYFKEIEGKSVNIGGNIFSEERGNTNIIVSMFVKFGIPVTLGLILSLYKQNLFSHKFSFFIVMLISLMSEPLLVVYFVILLIMSSVKFSVEKISLSEQNILNANKSNRI